MKKAILVVSLILGLSGVSKADENIWFNLGSLQFNVPLVHVEAVGLWDFVQKRGLAGAETPLISYKNIQITGGAITTIDGEGSPFVGAHVVLQNPAENFAPLAGFHPGIFGGRDFNNDAWILGLKATVGLF